MSSLLAARRTPAMSPRAGRPFGVRRRAGASRSWAGGLAMLLLAVGLVAAPTPTPAVAADATVVVTFEHGGDNGDRVLAGDAVELTVRARNSSSVDAFNVAVWLDVPVGVSYVDGSSAWGTPSVLTRAELLGTDGLPVLPEGVVRWVWEDVSDLPAGAVTSASFSVDLAQPDRGGGETLATDVFPVGSTVDITASAATSDNATLLPVFPGASGVGGPDAVDATATSTSVELPTRVTAIRVTKSEPSDESELLRGVHDHPTVFSILVEQTKESTSSSTVLVDYIPAGLEFLGCGLEDNSSSPAREYDAADSLTATPDLAPMGSFTGSPGTRDGCLTPKSVDTVVGDPDAPTADVYTKVTWDLGILSAGSKTTLRYAAGIPMRENVPFGDGVHSIESGDQGANLDNNTGPTTRQGAGDGKEWEDGQVLTNVATASALYGGVVRTGTDRRVSDDDSEDVHAMDLAIVKSIAPGNPSSFHHGETVGFELTLRTSEYQQASDIRITDVLPNGLCPIVPAGVSVNAESGADDSCVVRGAVTESTNGEPATPAVVESVVAKADGSFVVTFAVDQVPGSSTTTILYDATMRTDYTDAQKIGATTSGDAFTNVVSFEATTSPSGVLDASEFERFGAEEPSEGVWDDSAASLTTDLPEISKKVMARDDVATTGDPCAAGSFSAALEGGFRLGDTVCFELRVDFPDVVATRGALVTDVLPAGLSYGGHAVDTAGTTPGLVTSVTAAGSQVQAVIGVPEVTNPAHYIAPGSVFVMHVWGTVNDVPATTADKLANLMKYRQHNVDGEVFFLRTEANFAVEPVVSLVKGVQEVDGASTRTARSQSDPDGNTFGSNRDGIGVREGETITYRVDLSSTHRADDVVVWDVLPTGFDAADVDRISAGGVVVEPSDAGYPDAARLGTLDGRTLVMWDGLAIPVDEFTLTYDVTVPAGTSVSSEHVNTASVVSYASQPNTSTDPADRVTYVPEGTPDLGIDASIPRVPAGDTSDTSSVYLPDATVTKSVTSGSATNNTASQVVIGEEAVFTYSVTVPAKATVLNGVLSDALPTPANWGVLADRTTVTFPGGGSTAPGEASFTVGGESFTVDPATGTVTFPATFDNATASDMKFEVTLVAYVRHRTAADGATATHSNRLTNTARFTSTGAPARTAAAQVTVIEPALTTTKTVSDPVVHADQGVVYTLKVANTSTRPTSFDTVLTDCLPAGLTIVLPWSETGVAVTQPGDVTCGLDRDLVTWTIGDLAGGATATLAIPVRISPDAAGGADYTNVATATGYSLPQSATPADRRPYSSSDDVEVLVPGGTITKAVDDDTLVIGQQAAYTVVVTLPKQVNFYDLVLTDVPPVGLAISDVALDYNAAWGTDPVPTVAGAGSSASPYTWNFADVSASAVERTITITYTGTVLDLRANVRGAKLTNTASFAWNVVNDDSTTRSTVDAPKTVTVHEPSLTVTKKVNTRDAADVAPGVPFTYVVTVSNGNTPTMSAAHDLTIVDTVPAGVVVDPASLVTSSGVLSGADPTTGAGGTITWTRTTLAKDDRFTFTYTGTLVATGLLTADDVADGLTNEVAVTEYSSHPGGPGYDPVVVRTAEGPEADAVVTPEFPAIAVTKTAATGLAYIDEDHGFTVRVENTGDAPAYEVEASDVLPAGWAYVAGTFERNGVAAADPAVSGQTLTWTVVTGAATVAAGAGVTYTYDAVPLDTYDWDATNTGSTVSHTNTVTVAGEDGSGSTCAAPCAADGSNDYTDSDDASVVIHRADLGVTKAHVAPVVAGTELDWTITVTNAGSDAAVGPIVVTDQLPEGVDFVSASGTGWTTSGPDAEGVLTLTRPGPLPAAATAPVITVTVFVPADTAVSAEITNEVAVDGRTFDPNPVNDEDDDTVTVTTSADLALVKSTVGTSYVAGTDQEWTIDVTNLGPSVSRTPFTVTDTLPAGVDASTVAVSGAGWALTSVADGVATFTYSGAHLGVDPGVDDSTTQLELSARVLSSFTSTLTNSATVVPTTPDPVPGNNTDVASSGSVDAEADLRLAKTLDSDDLRAGEGGTYRIAVANDGPSDAVGVVVTDTLPAGLTYAGNLTSADSRTWALGSQTPGASGTTVLVFNLTSAAGVMVTGTTAGFTFDVTVDADVTGDVTNEADVVSTTDDPDPTNDDDTETTTVLVETNVSLTKTHVSAVRRVGDTVDFSIVVKNEGPAVAEDVVVRDALPSGLTFTDVDPADRVVQTRGAWTVAVTGDEVEAVLDDPLGVGDSVELTVRARLTAPSFPSVINGAGVETSTTDTDPDDDSDTTVVPVDSPDLRVVKTAGATWVEGGDELTYRVVVTNHGGARADEVLVRDLLPAELEVVLAVPADVAVDSVTNAVSVSSDDEDPSLRGDNDDDVTTPVRRLVVDLAPACVLDAPWLGYEIDARNVPADLPVTFTWYADADGDGVADGDAISEQVVATTTGSVLSGRVLWPGTTVDDDGRAVLLTGHRPAERGETPEWQNLVLDPDLPEAALRDGALVRVHVNPEASATITYPAPSAECAAPREGSVGVDKTVDAEILAPDDEATYTLVVTNTGVATLRDVVLVDTLPAALAVVGVVPSEPVGPTQPAWGECTHTGADTTGSGAVLLGVLSVVLVLAGGVLVVARVRTARRPSSAPM